MESKTLISTIRDSIIHSKTVYASAPRKSTFYQWSRHVTTFFQRCLWSKMGPTQLKSFFQKLAAGNKYAMLMIIWSSCTVMSTFQDYWSSSKQLHSSIASSHLAYSPQYCWVVLAFLSWVKSSTRIWCNEETSTKVCPEISQGVESKGLQEKRRWVNGEFIVRPDKGGVELGKVIPLM